VKSAAGPDEPTGDVPDGPLFPEPIAVISLRNATTYRDWDCDGQPVLIITDGVTTVAFDSGLAGLSVNLVVASHRLADSMRDFATSITARWQLRDRGGAGRHRRNRRMLGPRGPRGNSPRP
jgi:hypothetical protein